MFLSIKGLIMFCKFLTNTYHFTYDNVKPCCWIKHTPETQIKINDPELTEKFKHIRQINDWTPECSYCYDLESSGTASPRTLATKEDIFTDEDELGDAIKVELQLDDDCNAACLMCGTWNSTTWQQYETKTLKTKLPSYRWQTTVEERIEVVRNMIDFNMTKQVHFFGGEPFNGETQLKMLRLMEHPENIKLVYTTNGSVFPSDETLELWKKFKNVHVGISIDGIGEQFNYLRWPLQWHQVENNLIKYINLNYDNVTINTSFTATPFNIWYIDKYTDWSIEFSKKYKSNKTDLTRWFLNPHPVVGDKMNMSCIPPGLEEAVIAKFGKDSRVAKLIMPFDVQTCLHMINYTQFHDRHRQTDWKKTFPEIVDYFDMDILAPVRKSKVWEIKSI
jgi:hypothetical protein